MTPTLDDLRDVAQSHADLAPHNPSRGAQVRRRVTRAHRRRAVAAGIAGLGVIAVLTFGSGSWTAANRATQPAGDPGRRVIDGLSEWWWGGHLVAIRVVSLTPADAGTAPVFDVAVPVPVAGLDVAVPVVVCSGERELEYDISYNGAFTQGGKCPTSTSIHATMPAPPGTPPGSTIHLTVRVGNTQTTPLPTGVHSTVRIGSYEQVPRSSYVFPARPSGWSPHVNIAGGLGGNPSGGTAKPPIPLLEGNVDSGPTERSFEVVVPVGSRFVTTFLNTGAPGVITVYLDGGQVHRIDAWGWNPTSNDISVPLDGTDAATPTTTPHTVRIVMSQFQAPSWALKIYATQ